jgi:hypothetical protein
VTAGRGWYRGDCHVHSVYSDGQLTVGQLAAGARAAGLDFIATTEHNTADAHGAWQAHDGGGLLVILGEEVTTAGGHWLALGLRPGQLVDWRYRAEDQAIGRQLDQVHDVGGLCVVAHPHAPYPGGSFTYPYQGFDAVEVWNGQWTSDRPWNADNEAALAGWARSLAAGAADGRRWAAATPISRASWVLRSWIAESAAVGLAFTAAAAGRDAGPGERLATSGLPAVVRAEVRRSPTRSC